MADVSPLEVALIRTPRGPAIKASGELDDSNVTNLRNLIDSHLRTDPEPLLFELSDLTFMDSSGIAALVNARKKAKELLILNPTSAVRRVIEVTGLADVLKMEP